jgi:hypothetical protein
MSSSGAHDVLRAVSRVRVILLKGTTRSKGWPEGSEFADLLFRKYSNRLSLPGMDARRA